MNCSLIKNFDLISIGRYPDDRPNIVELQNQPFFKQAKRTTLAENLSLTGIDKYNCTKLSSGKGIKTIYNTKQTISPFRTAKFVNFLVKMCASQVKTSVYHAKWLTWASAVSLNGIFNESASGRMHLCVVFFFGGRSLRLQSLSVRLGLSSMQRACFHIFFFLTLRNSNIPDIHRFHEMPIPSWNDVCCCVCVFFSNWSVTDSKKKERLI